MSGRITTQSQGPLKSFRQSLTFVHSESKELSASAEVLASFRAVSMVTSELNISWIYYQFIVSMAPCIALLSRSEYLPAMLKYMTFITPLQSQRGSSSVLVAQTIVFCYIHRLWNTPPPSKTISSLLDLLISFHRDEEVTSCTVFEITQEDISDGRTKCWKNTHSCMTT